MKQRLLPILFLLLNTWNGFSQDDCCIWEDYTPNIYVDGDNLQDYDDYFDPGEIGIYSQIHGSLVIKLLLPPNERYRISGYFGAYVLNADNTSFKLEKL